MGLRVKLSKEDGSPLGTSVSVEIVLGKEVDGKTDREQAIILLPGALVPKNVAPRIVAGVKAGDPHLCSLYEWDGEEDPAPALPAQFNIVQDPGLGQPVQPTPFIEQIGNGTQPFDGSNVTTPATPVGEEATWAFDPNTPQGDNGAPASTVIPQTPPVEVAVQGQPVEQVQGANEPQFPPLADYDNAGKSALELEVQKRREGGRLITVTGTGANGNIKSSDLADALKADDAAAAAE